ncbi:hypothetical protein Ancab_013397 [Ancistrocladus abbreviatus]
MSTIVFKEFKSCHESHLTEPCSLSLKLSSPKLDFYQNLELPKESSILDSGVCSWSCIKALCYSSSNSLTEVKEKPEVYVPPVLKRTASVLSGKSLEMCTENLGSETGTDLIEFSVFPSTAPENSESLAVREMRKSRQKVEIKRAGQLDFPPPLTTISGLNTIHTETQRENGRLVIKAFSAPARHSCMQAERSDGHLRLSILRDYSSDIDPEEEQYQEAENGVVCDREVKENEECEHPLSEGDEVEEEEEEEGGEEQKQHVEGGEGEKQETDEVCLGRDTDGNNWDVGVKIGMGEFQRPSRCKEGGRPIKRLTNWEAFWVATS